MAADDGRAGRGAAGGAEAGAEVLQQRLGEEVVRRGVGQRDQLRDRRRGALASASRRRGCGRSRPDAAAAGAIPAAAQRGAEPQPRLERRVSVVDAAVDVGPAAVVVETGRARPRRRSRGGCRSRAVALVGVEPRAVGDDPAATRVDAR